MVLHGSESVGDLSCSQNFVKGPTPVRTDFKVLSDELEVMSDQRKAQSVAARNCRGFNS